MFRRIDRCPLVGAHRFPEHAKVGEPIDASAGRIDPRDGAGREDIAEQFAADKFEFVETLDVAQAVGSDADRLADRKGARVGVIERRAAVAEDQVGSVIAQAPAVARIAHLALELAGEIVDEHLVFLPSQLEHFTLEDGQALAEHGGTEIGQSRHFPIERNLVEPGRPADASGALVEPVVMDLEPLGEADFAARNLVDNIETQRRGFAAGLNARVGGTALDEQGEGRALPYRMRGQSAQSTMPQHALPPRKPAHAVGSASQKVRNRHRSSASLPRRHAETGPPRTRNARGSRRAARVTWSGATFLASWRAALAAGAIDQPHRDDGEHCDEDQGRNGASHD